MSSFMSRALRSLRARRCLLGILPSRPLISTPHLSECPFYFHRGTQLISPAPAPARRLHSDGTAEAVPSTFHQSTDEGRRTITLDSADVSALLARHLNKTFTPLEFPPALAQRVLTHLSHHDSVRGHNSRFTFLGVFCNVLLSI